MTSIDRPRLRVVPRVEGERLAHRQVRRDVAVLGDDADALAPLARALRRVDPEHLNLAGAALAVALEDLDRRRLARSVGAEEREDLAARDLEIDAADGLEVTVGLAQPADGYGQVAHPAMFARSAYSSSTSRCLTRSDDVVALRRPRRIRSATVTERWRPPVQPIAIVRWLLPSAT